MRENKDDFYNRQCNKCKMWYCGYDNDFNVNGEIMCFDYFDKWRNENQLPYFQNHIPNFCDDFTYKVFTFLEPMEFYNKFFNWKEYFSKDNILVVDDGYIMTQNIKTSNWWVIGYIYIPKILNFFFDNLPNFNSQVYNNDKTINEIKKEEWLKDKLIIDRKWVKDNIGIIYED